METDVERVQLNSLNSDQPGQFETSDVLLRSRAERGNTDGWASVREWRKTIFFGIMILLLIVFLIWRLSWAQHPSENEELHVHLIPHSHDDVGWLGTVDEYFYGSNKDIKFAGVQYIIDTVVTQLTEHPSYRFVLVEMAFLSRWWHQATQKDKFRMKTLVANGQLHFANGGWCASDEATMYYEDFIDQMTVGLRWLKQNLQYIPEVAWHIDPFGHHASTASLFYQMGFKGIFFSRIDFQDKALRLQKKEMEMLWRPPQLSTKNISIFTHITYHHYSYPFNFNFDPTTQIDSIKFDPNLEGYNLDIKSQQLVKYFREQAQHYRTKNIMHLIGDDFHYSNARIQFKNYQKLIDYINNHPEFNVSIKFSTPDEYIEEIYNEGEKYPVKIDDFLPYSDRDHSYWTGFFTSRTAFKGFVRDFSRYFQTAKKHLSEVKLRKESLLVKSKAQDIEKVIFSMETAHGILQHHDAITGTAKQRVQDDYISTALKAIEEFNKIYLKIKQQQILSEIGQKVSNISLNIFWNQTGTITGLSQILNSGRTALISFYNPGGQGNYPIRLRVPALNLSITYQDNSEVEGDVVCGNLRDSTDCQLWFNLKIGASSNAYLKISEFEKGSGKIINLTQIGSNEVAKEFILGNDGLKFIPNKNMFKVSIDGRSETFQISYKYYEGQREQGQYSGAYIFRPHSERPKPYSEVGKVYYTEGKTMVMFVLEGDSTVTKVYFSKITDYVERYGFLVESQLDSIPVSDEIGKQIILSLKTEILNKDIFFTDSMGLEEQRRKLNFRSTWDLKLFEPVASNFYPINSFIRIEDHFSSRSVTVLADRSQGASVLNEGEFQIMIHRRLLVDDDRGVAQALNEIEESGQGLKQTVRHYIVLGKEYRKVQQYNDQRILPTFGTSKSPMFKKVSIRESPIKLPNSVKLQLRPFEDGSYLLRFHNMDPQFSVQIVLDKQWVLEETTLSLNQLLGTTNRQRLNWKEEGSQSGSKQQTVPFDSSKITVEEDDCTNNNRSHLISLKPFGIKTFRGHKR